MCDFSIIIPVFNSEKTIFKCIESVVNQDFKGDIEVIFVNDGSIDNSDLIITSFIKNKLFSENFSFVYFVQKNQGVSVARNKGIELSGGTYIAFLDSDDYWHPQKLSIMYNIFLVSPCDILAHSYSYNINFNQSFNDYFFKIKKIKTFNLLFKNFAVTPSVVIKKKSIDLFDPSMRYCEDHDLWLRMSYSHDICYVPLPLVVLGRPLLSAGGLSSNRIKMRIGEVKLYLKYAKRSFLLWPFIPFLIIFSFLKFLKAEVIWFLKYFRRKL